MCIIDFELIVFSACLVEKWQKLIFITMNIKCMIYLQWQSNTNKKSPINELLFLPIVGHFWPFRQDVGLSNSNIGNAVKMWKTFQVSEENNNTPFTTKPLGNLNKSTHQPLEDRESSLVRLGRQEKIKKLCV